MHVCDIPRITDVLDQVQRSLDAWQGIEQEIANDSPNAPTTMSAAEQRVRDEVFPPGTPQPKKVGGLDAMGAAKLSPEFVANNCDIVVESTKVHERAHSAFYLKKYPAASMTAFTDRQRTCVRAASEDDAHEAQAKYLTAQLQRLQDDCSKVAPTIDKTGTYVSEWYRAPCSIGGNVIVSSDFNLAHDVPPDHQPVNPPECKPAFLIEGEWDLMVTTIRSPGSDNGTIEHFKIIVGKPRRP